MCVVSDTKGFGNINEKVVEEEEEEEAAEENNFANSVVKLNIKQIWGEFRLETNFRSGSS